MSDHVWRAGFEIEVILGDLDDSEFAEFCDDAMDVAHPSYCRSLARRLREETGYPWKTLRKPPRAPGFYVVPEYDLDPLRWPWGRVAGVELLTPPLPLAEADIVRHNIVTAIDVIDGEFNFERNEHTEGCAWHINIDCADREIAPDRICMAVDELDLLAQAERLHSQYASPQSHSYGPALLRHLELDNAGKMLGNTGLTNFLGAHAGRGKRYAANFEKLERGYLELRHFNATQFLVGPNLDVLLAPIVNALEMWASEEEPFETALRCRFNILHEWLTPIRHMFRFEAKPATMITAWFGEVTFDGQRIGHLTFNGTLDITLENRTGRETIGAIWDLQWPDAVRGIAICALNYAHLIKLGVKPGKSQSAKFQKELDRLFAMLAKASSSDIPAFDPSVRESLRLRSALPTEIEAPST